MNNDIDSEQQFRLPDSEILLERMQLPYSITDNNNPQVLPVDCYFLRFALG